ncbi:hypothetical protein A9Q84_09970 [Halobacteriovorax marinus]|uniref:Uncharacterized protein n=1 Tax=Halobacteriovorax marinus TaxID=97084 RepID=A0A1Y5FCU1_9BACT|nr:hypothetical protein A9Q84_09970 [Halobacteriovorax marinus]
MCVKSFGEIYKTHDKENQCDLYFAPTSIFADDIAPTDREKVSITAALNFDKFEGQINLKGLWSLIPLVADLKIKEDKADYFMSHTFHSICLSSDKEIIHDEMARSLFNNWNDYDREVK